MRRMIAPVPPIKKKIPPDTSAISFSKFVISGTFDIPDVVKPIYDEINKLYGTKLKPDK